MRFSACKTVLQYVTLLCMAMALVSCGGSDDEPGGELTTPTARLSAFSIDSFDIDFDPASFGPYIVEVPSDTDSLTFSAQAASGVALRYELGFGSTDPRFIAPDLTDPLRSTAFNTDTPVTIDLNVGENLLRVSAIGDNSNVVTQYSFTVRRLSAQAALTELNVFIGTTAPVLTPEFTQDVFNYTLEIPATSCAVTLSARTLTSATNVVVNGEDSPFGALQTILTPVGETSIDVAVSSEDGSSSNMYNVILMRPEPTADESDTLSTLSALSIDGAAFDFDCTTTAVLATIGGNQQSDDDVPFTATLNYTPTSPNATVALIEQEVNTLTGEVNSGEVIALTNNEAFELPLELGLNFYQLRVTPVTGPANFYNLSIESVERTVKTVSTPQALQQALLDAQPNDEIRIEEGTLTATASTSGVDTAYFYSNQSGTEQAPIFLSGQLANDGATLTGDGDDTRAVLQLDGDHWVVANLNITGAQTGVLLNGASNIIVEGITVDDGVSNGVVIENGSNNNHVVQSVFDTQDTAIIVGSDSTTWQPEQGGQGTLVSDNTRNIVRGNVFTQLITAPLIEVNEGAQNSIVEFNRFTPSKPIVADQTGTVIAVQGNDTVIRYNFIEQSGSGQTEALIRVRPASVDNLPVEYGQDTQVYANQVVQSAAQLFVQADTGLSVLADGNTRVDSEELTYEGDAANTTAFSMPFFRLQPSINRALCIEVDAQTFIANTQTCNAQDNQDWRITLNDNGFIELLNRVDVTRALALTSTINANQPFGILAAPTNVGSRLQVWVPDFNLSAMRFLSRETTQFGLVTVLQGDDLVFAASDVTNFLSAPDFVLEYE